MRKTIILVALVAFASPVQAQYEIRISTDTQDIAVSLNLVANSETPTKLMLRGAAWGLQPQVDNVRCASGPLPQDTDGNWTAPAGCKTVTWTVVPDRLSPEGADASEQRSLVGSPGPWFLLSEPTSLLRPQPTEAATIRAAPGSGQVIGATSVEAGVFRVPPSGSAPEFYVLGSAALSRRTVGAVEITYVATTRWSAAVNDKVRIHGASKRRAQLNRWPATESCNRDEPCVLDPDDDQGLDIHSFSTPRKWLSGKCFR